jgi:hypothetical protein
VTPQLMLGLIGLAILLPTVAYALLDWYLGPES